MFLVLTNSEEHHEGEELLINIYKIVCVGRRNQGVFVSLQNGAWYTVKEPLEDIRQMLRESYVHIKGTLG